MGNEKPEHQPIFRNGPYNFSQKGETRRKSTHGNDALNFSESMSASITKFGKTFLLGKAGQLLVLTSTWISKVSSHACRALRSRRTGHSCTGLKDGLPCLTSGPIYVVQVTQGLLPRIIASRDTRYMTVTHCSFLL